MAFTDACIRERENVSPGRTWMSCRSSGSDTTSSPAMLMPDTVKRGPSVMFTVMNTSSLSGEIVTCVDSMLNSR